VATFILIPGAGGAAWYWHPVVSSLEERGHRAVAVDLPGGDEKAGLDVYADRVVEAMAGEEVVLVAQSMGGFTAAMVAARVPLRSLIFLNAMIPIPGETAGEWWDHVGAAPARIAAAKAHGYSEKFDLETYFLHDLSPQMIAESAKHQSPEAEIAFSQPCAFERWPDIPIMVVAGREDRFFPVELQRRVARDRLGRDIETVPGGHLAALSQPAAVVERLLQTPL
jgi:pimeloyl-ACP methyl ester carboxylesterase